MAAEVSLNNYSGEYLKSTEINENTDFSSCGGKEDFGGEKSIIGNDADKLKLHFVKRNRKCTIDNEENYLRSYQGAILEDAHMLLIHERISFFLEKEGILKVVP